MHEEDKYKCDLEQKTFEYMYDQQKVEATFGIINHFFCFAS